MQGTTKCVAALLGAVCLIGIVAAAGCSHQDAAAADGQKDTAPAGQFTRASSTIDRKSFAGGPMPPEARAAMAQWIQSHASKSGGAPGAAVATALKATTAPGK